MEAVTYIGMLCEVKMSYSIKKRPSYKVCDSKTIFEYIKGFYPQDMDLKEFFYAIYLNSANKVLGYHKVGKGGVAGVYADTKLIMSAALNCVSNSIILVHNHPSGNMKASVQDIQLTNKVKEACKLFDMTLLDHLIVGHNVLDEMVYYSFADEGLI